MGAAEKAEEKFPRPPQPCGFCANVPHLFGSGGFSDLSTSYHEGPVEQPQCLALPFPVQFQAAACMIVGVGRLGLCRRGRWSGGHMIPASGKAHSKRKGLGGKLIGKGLRRIWW